MRTWTIAGRAGAFAGAGVFAVAILLSGCPSSAEKKPAKVPPPGPVARGQAGHQAGIASTGGEDGGAAAEAGQGSPASPRRPKRR